MKNSTSTPSTAPTTHGECVCLRCGGCLPSAVTLSGSRLCMLPSQPLTWLHCAAPVNALPFFPLPRQPDTLHRRHLGRSQSVWVLFCLGLRLPLRPHTHTHTPLPSFYPLPIDRVTARPLTDGGITAVTSSRRVSVMFYRASVVPRDASRPPGKGQCAGRFPRRRVFIYTHAFKSLGGHWLIIDWNAPRVHEKEDVLNTWEHVG